MKVLHTVLVALATAVTLTSVAAAGPDAAKQRVAITVTMMSGKAVLEPLQKGALVRSAGTFGFVGVLSQTPDRTVMRDGQEVDIYSGTWKFTGKRGTLVFRERNEWVDLGQDLNRDGSEDGIAIGTWKVVRGTGRYAGITGGGRSAHLGQGRVWVIRYEGFLTRP
jgi:hypothetical protein